MTIEIKGDGITLTDLKTGASVPLCNRNDVIEECARVAETWHIQKALWPRDAGDIAAAIRALKDKA